MEDLTVLDIQLIAANIYWGLCVAGRYAKN